MKEITKLVGYGVDTLMLNVRYTDEQDRPIRHELDVQLVATIDYLQGAAQAA